MSDVIERAVTAPCAPYSPIDETQQDLSIMDKTPHPVDAAIEAMARAIDPLAWSVKCFDFPDLDMPPRQREAKTRATAAYDALLAMGAIREPRIGHDGSS
jgi:hypothetical protein